MTKIYLVVFQFDVSFSRPLAVAAAFFSLLGEIAASSAIESRTNDANSDFISRLPLGKWDHLIQYLPLDRF